jgi:predicted Zn-dependent protease
MAPEYSPIIYDYLRKYQEDPTSRVFAPLAEAYRKAGLIDEAIEVAREGLRVHPSFVGGRVALARALFDKQTFAEVIEELREVVRDVPDNLAAQRLFAESSLMIGETNQALESYKLLLYFVPTDPELAKIVSELENQAYRDGSLVLRTDAHATPEPTLTLVRPSGQEVQKPPVDKQKLFRQIDFLQSLLVRVGNAKVRASL